MLRRLSDTKTIFAAPRGGFKKYKRAFVAQNQLIYLKLTKLTVWSLYLKIEVSGSDII
jgi:hypothetical protein